MAKIGVALKISVNMIDKARLFAGAKNTYLDATVFVDIDQLDQYGNSGMITQDVSKEEKAAGVQGNILGNCKVFWKDQGQQQQVQQPQQQYQQPQQQQAPQSFPKPQQQQAQQQGFQNQTIPVAQPPATPPMDFDDSIPF